MSTPYDPIIRHEPISNGDELCAECKYATINHYCGNRGCRCICNQAALSPEDYVRSTAEAHGLDPDKAAAQLPQWEEPPAQPEHLKTWEEITARPMKRISDDMRIKPGNQTVAMEDIEEKSDPTTPAQRRGQRMRNFIAKWEIPFAITTVVLYLCLIPILVVVFPDVSNLWVSIFVLLTGFTGSMTALASVLKTRNQ
jgi:hypothetical protein